MRRLVRLGPLVFRDPLLLCGALYLLLWFDASGFLRIGLCAPSSTKWVISLSICSCSGDFPSSK